MSLNFYITPNAQNHIANVSKVDAVPPILRIKVDSGGCSGFKYIFEFVSSVESDGHIFEVGEVKVIVDSVSLPFLENAELDFIDEMMGSYFMIRNPNAQSSCGCGSSFSV